jgi:glycosyltransferase involved in cell wall biosynthesis
MFYAKWMPFSYRKAVEIICDSNSTKSDLVRILQIPPEKITVVHLACDEKFSQKLPQDAIKKVKNKYGLQGDYILHVGTLEPRKNLDFLADVFAEAIKDTKNQNLKLVITGKKGWYYEGLFKKVKDLGLVDKVVFTGYLDEADKVAVYQGAKIFAFPSIYEGFGLPPLEAMSAGVPVISSDTSSMPEVVGEAGILLSPKDKKSWVEAITRVNSDEKLRKEMIEKNKLQVSKFSWERTAQKNIEVFNRAWETFNKEKEV